MIRSCIRSVPSRVRIAAAVFCMQLALGAVYGWSVFVIPLREQFGASKVMVTLTFTITLAVLGVTEHLTSRTTALARDRELAADGGDGSLLYGALGFQTEA